MQMKTRMIATSAQVAAIGCAGPSQLFWDPSHLSVVGERETMSTQSASPGLDKCLLLAKPLFLSVRSH